MKDDKFPLEPEITPVGTPRQEGFYETGNTRPAKNHHKAIATVLIIYVVLGGFFGLMTMLNISLALGQDARHALAFTDAAPRETEPLQILPTEPAAQNFAASGARMTLVEAPAAVANIPQEGGLSLQEIHRRVAPSVVSITARTELGTRAGSGIIMSGNGYLITNCHVVDGAVEVAVILESGESFEAALVGQDRISDMAVLKIDARGLSPAEFGNSDNAQVGDSVVAIGSPLGEALPGTMTDGIISAINRNVKVEGSPMTLLQTNAAINSGNSGGPLINCYGQVIGIITAKVGDQYSAAGVEGLGFAIPTSNVKEIVEQLIQYGYVPGRPGFGMELEEFSALYSVYYNLPSGLWISRVWPGSLAEELGIDAGDILTQVNGVSVTTLSQAQAMLSGCSAGDTVAVTVFHQGFLQEFPLVLVEAQN